MGKPTSSKPGAGGEWVCPVCQSPNHASANRCWLCQSAWGEGAPSLADPEIDRVVPGLDRRQPGGPDAKWIYLALLAASVVVVAGMSHRSPRLALLAGVLLGVALLSTALKGSAARARGREMPAESLAYTFFKSLVITGLILGGLLGLAVLALVIGLFVVCSGMLGHA